MEANLPGVAPDQPLRLGLPRGVVRRDEWSPGQAEAVRLETLRQVSFVKDEVIEGLAVVHTAESENDFQQLMGGLRKLLVAGLLAKDVADAALRRYGPEAAGL